MKTGRSRRTVTPRRVIRRHRWSLEQLENRTLLTSGAGDDIGDATLLNTPSDVRTGSVAPGSPVFFEIDTSADALLVARVQSAGGYTRLSLLDSLGRLLVQSDGQSATNPDDLIEIHLNAGTDYLEVQSRGGSASFTFSTNLTVSSQPYQPVPAGAAYPIAFADFNGDKVLDFAELDGIHLNSGDGTFIPPSEPLPLVGLDPSSFMVSEIIPGSFGGAGGSDLAVLATDPNGDGDADVEVLLNDGAGNFTPQLPVRLPLAFPVIIPSLPGGTSGTYYPPSLVAGHFTSGSYDDLAVGGNGSSGRVVVQLILKQPDGSFQPGASFTLSDATQAGVIAAPLTGHALDADGQPLDDLAVISQDDQNVQVLQNDGGGSFETGTQVGLTLGPEGVVAGHFTSHGQALDDLAVVGQSTSSGFTASVVADVLTNDGSGGFRAGSPIALDLAQNTLNSPQLVAADFNGDGLDDLAVAGQDISGNNRVDGLVNEGGGVFQAMAPVSLGALSPIDLFAGNLTGTVGGRVDLAVSGFDSADNNLVEVLTGLGDGAFAASTVGGPAPLSNDPYIGLGPLDPYSEPGAPSVNSVYASAVSGHFTADGRLGVVVPVETVTGDNVTGETYDNRLEVLLDNGDGTFRAAPAIDLGELTPIALTVGNYGGDGFDDLAVATGYGQDFGVYVFLSNGNDTFHAEPQVEVYDFETVQDLVSGNFTGGPLDDLAVAGGAYDTSNIAEVLSNQGGGSFLPSSPIELGSLTPYGMAAGHFTSANRDDFAVAGSVQDALGNTEYQVAVVSRSDHGKFQAGSVTPLGALFPLVVVAGNFSGNPGGLDDLAVASGTVGYDSVPGSVQVLLNHQGDGTFTPGQTIDLGDLDPSAMVVGPVFAAGQADLAVVGNDSYGNNSVIGNMVIDTEENMGGAMFSPGPSITLDSDFDVPLSLLLGDFTGNGNLDLLLTTALNEVILLSGDGGGSFDGATGGAPLLQFRDTPLSATGLAATADFNDDGRLDLAFASEGAGEIDGNTDLVQHDSIVTVQLCNGDASFVALPPVDLGVMSPIALVVGDFNGDGFPDVAALGYGSSGDAEVDVLENQGGVDFRALAPTDLGRFEPVAIVSANFNGTGRSDLAVVGYDASGQAALEVLLGNKDGTFTVAPPVELGDVTVHALVSADFINGDGRPDLAIAVVDALGQGGVDILLGKGDGTFRAPVSVSLGSVIPVDLVSADFKSDGRTDLAVAGQDRVTGHIDVTVLAGNGDGTFRASEPSDLGAGFLEGLLTGDFNRDGRTDLAVASDSNPSLIRILLGNGDGTFRAPVTSSFTELAAPTVAGDFNRDGATDLALVIDASTVQVELSQGDGSFSPTGELQRSIPVVADPGDGSSDVFVVNQAGNILWRRGEPNSPGAFAPPVTINPGFPSRGIAFVPTRSGALIASIDLQHNAVSLYVYHGGQFTRAPSLTTGDFPSQIIAADLNGDGNTDLIVRDVGDGTAVVYLGNGSGGFIEQSVLQIGIGASAIGLVQLDPHGPIGLIVTNQNTGDVRVFLGNGDGTYQSPSVYQAGSSPYALANDGTTDLVSLEATAGAAVGTFYRGGQTDIAVINPGSNSFAVLDGLGGNAIANPQRFFTTTPATAVVAADFNGDRVSDLALLGSDGVSVYLGDGQGGFGEPTTYNVGPDPTGLSVADLNGHPDLLVADGYGDVLVLLGDGQGHFATPRNINQQIALAVADLRPAGPKTFAFAEQGNNVVSVQAGAAAQPQTLAGRSQGILDPGAVTLADLTNNGILDLIVANSGANDVLVYLGLPGGGFGPAQSFPVGTDPVSVTVADLTGDIPDLIVANGGSNDLSILRGQGQGSNWTLTPWLRLTTGSGPTSTVVRDVYGNGIPDILVTDSQSNDVRLIKGVGGGFFNDTSPIVFPTGIDPGSVLVGNFTGRPGELDMVTINAGSNDLTQYLDINGGGDVAQTIPSGGAVPVAAVEGDFGGGPIDDLLVANNADGHLALFVGGAGGLNLSSTFEEAGLANPTALAMDSSGSVFGASEGVVAAVPVILGLGPESPSPVTVGGGVGLTAGQADQQVALLQPLSQASLALVATLLSVTGEEPAGNGSGSGTTGAAALPNQAQPEGVEVNQSDGGSPQGDASALEALARNLGQAIAAEVARFVSGLDRALAKARVKAARDRLFVDPEDNTGTAIPAGAPDDGSPRRPPPAGGVTPAMPAKAADLGDAGTAPGITAGTAPLPATATQEPPPAAIPSPAPAGAERLSLAHAALGVGTSSIGWVAVTHTFADLIPGGGVSDFVFGFPFSTRAEGCRRRGVRRRGVRLCFWFPIQQVRTKNKV